MEFECLLNAKRKTGQFVQEIVGGRERGREYSSGKRQKAKGKRQKAKGTPKLKSRNMMTKSWERRMIYYLNAAQ